MSGEPTKATIKDLRMATELYKKERHLDVIKLVDRVLGLRSFVLERMQGKSPTDQESLVASMQAALDAPPGEILSTREVRQGDQLGIAINPELSRLTKAQLPELILQRALACTGYLEAEKTQDAAHLSLENASMIAALFTDHARLLALASQPYFAIGKLDVASRYLRRALDVDPDDALANRMVKFLEEDGVELPPSQPLRLVRSFTEDQTELMSGALSEDGRVLVAGSFQGPVRVWDLSTGERRWTLEGHAGRVRAVAVAPAGHVAITGSADKTLRVWDLTTGRLAVTLTGHEGEISGLAFLPDGRLLAAADDGLRLWDLEAGTSRVLGKGGYESVSVSGDGRTAVAARGGAELAEVWDVAGERLAHTLRGHKKDVGCAAISADGRVAATGSEDRHVRVWNVATGACVAAFEAAEHHVLSIALSGNGRVAAVGDRANAFRLWDFAEGAALAFARAHEYGVSAVMMSPRGELAVTISAEAVSVWQLRLPGG